MNNVIDCNVTSRYKNGMFVKLFSQILDSSIADNRKLRHFFTDLLLCADASGNVMMTDTAIARRIGATVDEVEWGLKELSSPDHRSKTPDYEGRRIERLEGHGYGWKILNYEMYRAMRDAEQLREATRIRVQRHRAKKAGLPCNDGNALRNASNAMQKAEGEVDAEEEVEAKESRRVKPSKLDSPLFESNDSPEFREAMTEWFEYKVQRKERYTPDGWKRITSQQRRYEPHFIKASVDASIRNGWKGLFTEKIEPGDASFYLPKRKIEELPVEEYDPLSRIFAKIEARKNPQPPPSEEPTDLEPLAEGELF
jgi:hypothetical protein